MAARGTSDVITASGGIVSIGTDSNPAVGIEVNSPDSWAATLVVEATVDGSRWFTPKTQTPTGATGPTSFTANGRCTALVDGCAAVQVRCTSYSSGSPKITLRATRAI